MKTFPTKFFRDISLSVRRDRTGYLDVFIGQSNIVFLGGMSITFRTELSIQFCLLYLNGVETKPFWPKRARFGVTKMTSEVNGSTFNYSVLGQTTVSESIQSCRYLTGLALPLRVCSFFLLVPFLSQENLSF